jgi:hypothetical protein
MFILNKKLKRMELHEKFNHELNVVKLIIIVWILLRLDYDLSIFFCCMKYGDLMKSELQKLIFQENINLLGSTLFIYAY